MSENNSCRDLFLISANNQPLVSARAMKCFGFPTIKSDEAAVYQILLNTPRAAAAAAAE